MDVVASLRRVHAYDTWPWWYDFRGLFILWCCYRSSLRRQVRFFRQYRGMEHLDVACGTGTLLWLTLPRQWPWSALPQGHVTALDRSPLMHQARKRLQSRPDVGVLQGDATDLRWPDGVFDSVSLMNAWHCLDDPLSALKEIRRVLKPGGVLTATVLLEPYGRVATWIAEWGIRTGLLVRPWYRAEIRWVLDEAGFTEMTLARRGNCCEVVAR